MTERITGALLLLLAVAYATPALRMTGGGRYDFLGPQALPLTLAVLLGIASLGLALRPTLLRPRWPSAAVALRLTGTTVSLVLYANLLASGGFALMSTLVIFVVGVIHGGAPLRMAIAAVVSSLAILVLFNYALGIRLPFGTWWST